MRICLVNTYHYRRGGDSTYTFDLASLLKSRGDEVVHFAMRHPDNIRSEFEPYFAGHVDYIEDFKSGNPVRQVRAFLRSLYSFEAKAKFGALLDRTQPDVVHLQNFRRHLTFSVVQAARRRQIPVVFTAHDYDPICPNSLLFARGRVCEVCRGGGYHKALTVRCKEQAFLGTLAIVLEGAFVKMRRYYDAIDLVITPSEFARAKLIDGGFDPERVRTIHNFIDARLYEPDFSGRGVVYFGRLAYEKGLDVLLEAAKRLGRTPVTIAGDGPEKSRLKNLCLKSGCANVDFLGYVERGQLLQIVRKAMCVVMPSIWYENFPYSILEAFCLGKPVIASRIGGMPEIVRDGETGFLFEPGNSLALSERIQYLQENSSLVAEMGKQARARVEAEFDSDTHYDKLKRVYETLTD